MNQVIPLTSEHNQSFQCTVQIDGVNRSFQFDMRWNNTAQYWIMSITDLASGDMLIDSLPLVTGKINTESLNILRAFEYLGIGEVYLASIVSKPSSDYPNEINVSSEFNLMFCDIDENVTNE